MKLRDFGSWVGGMWDQIVSDLEIVVTSSPLEWPIWVFFAGFVLVFVIAPLVARKVLYEFRLYINDGAWVVHRFHSFGGILRSGGDGPYMSPKACTKIQKMKRYCSILVLQY